jgi:hypothetical protein
VLVGTYLVAFLIVMGIQLISRFFLAPKVSVLRFLPLDDATAAYLYRWVMAIAVVAIFGFLTCGIYRVAGVRILLKEPEQEQKYARIPIQPKKTRKVNH